MARDQQTESQRSVTAFAAVLAEAVILVGSVVCALWVLGMQDATQLIAESSAVRFSTGLSFVLGGAGLLLTLEHQRRWVLVAAVPMLLLSVLTLIEYWLDRNLWISELFIAGHSEPYPGRMAPNTAVGLLVAALGLVTLVSGHRRIWALSIASMLAALTVALGLVAALGYAFDLTAAFEWVGLVRMALLTAITLVLLGVGLILAAGEVGRAASWVEQPWLASSVGVGAAGLGLLASHALGAEVPELAARILEGLNVAAILFAALLAGTVAQARHMRLLSLELAIANRRQAEQSAEVSDLYENSPCGYHSLDAEARIVRINRTALAWLGYEREELIGRKTLFELLTPASRETYQASFTRLRECHEVRDLQLELVRRDGSTLPVVLSETPVCNAHGEFHHSRSTLFDDSERRRFDQALGDSKRRLQVLIDSVPSAVVVHDGNSAIEFANPSAEKLLGLTREQMLGRMVIDPAWHFVSEDGSPMPVEEYPVSRVIRSGLPLRDYVVGIHGAVPDSIRWVLVDATPAFGQDGRLLQVIVSFVDISERQQQKQQLELLASTDTLTGLATRRHLLELASHELGRARRSDHPLALIFFDIDHFKSINDRFGHEAGDQALRLVGETLQRELREVDIAARWGGEEFCVLLPEMNPQIALEIAERLRTAVEKMPMTSPDGAPLPVTASFGVALSKPEDHDLHRLVEVADKAMYQAKRDGRNCVRTLETYQRAAVST